MAPRRGAVASLLDAGVIEELDEPDDKGRTVRVTIDLQPTFALNQPLSPFALAALDLLDPESDTYALDVVSVIEAVLDDPRQILTRPGEQGQGRGGGRMKAEGMEYEERMAELEKITHPKPLAELLEPMFDVYRERHPWVAEHPLAPKSVARDLCERAMDFGEYVRFYNLARSEGTVLRYLSDVYKTLLRTVPEDAKTDELVDLIEWLGELVRQVDSSLLDEWEALLDPSAEPASGSRPRPSTAPTGSPPTAGRSPCWSATPCSSGWSTSTTASGRSSRCSTATTGGAPSGGSTPWRRTSRSTARSASAPTPATPPCC